ncbi:hydrolase 76 protein [Boothiomyces sp. JEL0866]|nr:hydrolase 76 protein [Boothiomyces sp. JEL0866]
MKVALPILSAAVYAITVDVNNKAAVKQITSVAAAKVASYYIPTGPNKTSDGKGCFPQHSIANDPTSFTWYEGGLYWGTLMDYTKITADPQYSTTVVNAITLASYGRVASFLGIDKNAAAMGGKWNDDIMWWALVPLTGAQIYGQTQVMPGGSSYLQLAINSYNDVLTDWTDDCGGGIYWSRWRESPNENERIYKSAITNAQHLLMGSVLYNITGNQTYLTNAKIMFDWIAKTIVLPDFMTVDGVNVNSTATSCPKVGPKGEVDGVYTSESYISGTIAAAMASLYAVTKNQTHIYYAEQIALKALSLDQQNGIIADRCDPKCDVSQVTPKGAYIRGLGVLYQITQNQKLKDTIKSQVQKTATAMLSTCDSTMTCNSPSWSSPQAINPNIHISINNMELLNTLSIIMNGVTDAPAVPPTQPPPAQAADPTDTGSAHGTFALGGLLVAVAAIIF